MLPEKSRVINVQQLPHEVVGFGQAPDSNTGSDSLATGCHSAAVGVRIDNLTLLWQLGDRRDFFQSIDLYLGIKFDINIQQNRKIGIVWHRSQSSPSGTLYSERDTADGKVYCRLSLSGQDCERADWNKLRGFMAYCRRYLVALSCSRVDIAVDDYAKALDYRDIEQALKEGNYTGFQSARVLVNYGEKRGGFTVYLGSRSSEKMVRFYDKFAESHGVYDCYRFEVEWKGDLANKMFALILDFPEDERSYHQELLDYAVSAIDFLDKKDKNLSRNIRLEWWENWIAKIQHCPRWVVVKRIKTTIEEKKNWIERSVSKSLLILERAIGVERLEHFLAECKERAVSRINTMDELILDDYRKHGHTRYIVRELLC